MGRGGRLERGIPARLTPSEGRKFAFPVGTAFLLLGALVLWRDKTTLATVFFSLTGFLYLAGLVAPSRLGPIYRGWMGFALLLSKVTTPIFMGITFFLVIGPVGLIMRLMGRNPIGIKEVDGSYWITRPEGKRRSDIKRQF
jgi:hypothetical protein